MAKKAEEGKDFYVGVSDPQDVHKQVLALTADYVRLQRNIEHISQIRTEKKEVLQALKKEIGSIKSAVSKLYADMPKSGIPHKVTEVHAKKSAHVVTQAKPKPQSEMQKLEAELAAIEQKMQGL